MKEEKNDQNQLETRNDVISFTAGNGDLRNDGKTERVYRSLDRNCQL